METLQMDAGDGDETEKIFGAQNGNLVFRKPQRSMKYTTSRYIIAVLGVLSILLGLATIVLGATSFFYLPFFYRQHSFQVENKWTNSIVLFSGLSAVAMAIDHSLTYVIATVTLSSLSLAMGLTTLIIHIVNSCFRQQDSESEGLATPDQQLALDVRNINIALAAVGAGSLLVSGWLLRSTLQIVARNYGYHLLLDKHRLRLSVLGFVQICIGILMTGWWTGLEIILKGESINLPTTEILAHGLVVTCAGGIQMVTTSKGAPPLLIATMILNGAAFLVTMYFASYPVSILLISVQHEGGGFTKMVLSAVLMLVYVVEIIIALYCAMKFSRVISVDRTPTIDFLFRKSRRLFLCLIVLQPIVGIVYAMVEVLAVGIFYIYKLEFSSMPIVSVFGGILAYASVQAGSPILISVTSALLGLGCALSTRDIYLFIYHASRGQESSDWFDRTRMDMGNIAIHFVQVLIAFAQVIVSGLIIVVLIRSLSQSLSMSSSALLKTNCAGKLRFLLSAIQTMLGVGTVIVGFDLFLSQSSLSMEDFGDRSIQLGLLVIFAGALSLAAKKRPLIILPSICAQITAFTLIWQESDRSSYLVHQYSLDLTGQERNASLSLHQGPIHKQSIQALNNTFFGLSCTLLMLLLVSICLGAFILLLSGKFLESCQIVICNLRGLGYPTDDFGYDDGEDDVVNGDMVDIPRDMVIDHVEFN